MKQLIVLLAGVGLATAPAYAQNYISDGENLPRIEFEGRYWMPELDGDIMVEDSGIGTTFDVTNDLGIDDENFPEGRLHWHTGPNSEIRLSYMRIEYEGDTTVSRTIIFEGVTYTAGARVVSNLDVQYFGLAWIWKFLNTPDERLKAGLLLDVKGIVLDVALDAPAFGISESEEFVGGAPTPGAVVEFAIAQPLKVYAEISGVPAGRYGHFFDAEGGLKWSPHRNIVISGGYRMMDIEINSSDDSAQIDMSGPFAAASLRF